MAGKIKSISDPRLHLDILSSQDVERIHTATLDVLEGIERWLAERGIGDVNDIIGTLAAKEGD